VNQRPVFGIVNTDSILYAPLLGFFAFTGIPTSVSGHLFLSVKLECMSIKIQQFDPSNSVDPELFEIYYELLISHVGDEVV
jgi:hypothetical protein